MPRDDRAGLVALPVQPLLQETQPCPLPPRELRGQLEDLAWSTDSLADRSERLLNGLRKRIGQAEAPQWVEGIAALVQAGDPAGARLLAALLDVHAPGAELVTLIHRFDSSRRLLALSRREGGGEQFGPWLRRLEELEQRCRTLVLTTAALPAPAAGSNPRARPPFSLLRRCLEELLARLARDGDLVDADKDLLVGLSRLEVDAYGERVSRLASTVNPYLASAVSRVLPLLGQADADLRAMHEFIQTLEAGRAGAAFRRRFPRFEECLSADERTQLLGQLEGRPGASDIGDLLRGVGSNPIPLRRLAGAAARLMVVAHGLRERGLRRTELDLLAAVAIVQAHERENELVFPIGGPLQAAVAEIVARRPGLLSLPSPDGRLGPDGAPAYDVTLALPMPSAGAAGDGEPALPPVLAEMASRPEQAGPGRAGVAAAAPAATGTPAAQGFDLWPFDGVQVRGDCLLVRVPLDGRADRLWRDDLPCLASDTAEAEAATKAAQIDTAQLKRLVLANLDNVSVTIGFLRNAKVVAIPGLVAQIVHRCRTVRILEIIAQDRTLHSGYANKDVPRALLISPCNVPVKSLAKFIHVKYVNKVDLQRMAKDKAGMRRELIKEIEAYLSTLGGG